MGKYIVDTPRTTLQGLRYRAEVFVEFRHETQVVSGTEGGSIALWDLKTGKCTRVTRAHSHCVTCLAVSPDGKRLATGGHDSSLKVWSLPSLKMLYRLDAHRRGVNSIAWSADGRLLLSAGSYDGSVRVWNARSKKELYVVNPATDSLKVAAGKELRVAACGDSEGRILLFDSMSGEELAYMKGHEMGIVALDFSPESRWLASCSTDGAIKLWDVAERRLLRTLRATKMPCSDVKFATDGAFLYSLEMDGPLRQWDMSTFRRSALAPMSANYGRLDVSPTGRLIATTANQRDLGAIAVWELPTNST